MPIRRRRRRPRDSLGVNCAISCKLGLISLSLCFSKTCLCLLSLHFSVPSLLFFFCFSQCFYLRFMRWFLLPLPHFLFLVSASDCDLLTFVSVCVHLSFFLICFACDSFFLTCVFSFFPVSSLLAPALRAFPSPCIVLVVPSCIVTFPRILTYRQTR